MLVKGRQPWSLISVVAILLTLAVAAAGIGMLKAQTASAPVTPAIMATGLATAPAFDPPALYLMWQHDPTTTMTVHWHTLDAGRPSTVEYQKLNETQWRSATGTERMVPTSERVIHIVELTGLDPGTEYRFRLGPNAKIYTFRTMPAQADRPIRFVTGGDTMHQKDWWENTNRQAARYDPEFALLGGDLSYADDNPKKLNRWFDWFDACKKTLITPANRIIPIVLAIGNHEVQGGFGKTMESSPFFYSFFSFPVKRGYNVLDFGNYMSIILLDSGHTTPVTGEQTQWLDKTLAQRQDVPHVFPIYHVPGYPSVRRFDDGVSPQIRKNWMPLFEKYRVRVAFENHDHAYKRTHPLRDGKVNYARGVVYIGDGAWGVGVRPVHPERWYLAKAQAIRHFIVVTLHGPHQQFVTVDEKGQVIDRYPTNPPEPL